MNSGGRADSREPRIAPMRLLRRASWGALSWLVLAGSVGAQPSAIETAQKDIRATYDFDPSAMSFAEQAKRAPALGALWNRYDKAPGVYREALRGALAAPGEPEMLYCDGGMLLLAKSKLPEDRRQGLEAISKCTLSEIQHTPYFYTMHALARESVDTFDLQLRMLTRTRYSAYIVAHALTLGQDYAFVYPLLVQDEARYVSRIADRLKVESDATALKTLVLALWYAATAESVQALRSVAASASHPPSAREEARKTVERVEAARGLWLLGPTAWYHRWRTDVRISDGEADIRAKRRARMRSISDEALIELDAYTPLLYRALKW